MRESYETNVVLAVVGSAVILICFAAVILYSVIRYNRKQRLAAQERQNLLLSFTEEKLKIQEELTKSINDHLAMEIHDHIGQILSLAKIQTNLLGLKLNTKWTDNLDQISNLIGEAIDGLRDMALKLKEDHPEKLDWVYLLKNEIEKIKALNHYQIKSDIDCIEPMITSEKKIVLLRMIQECLNNIVKHAQNKSIWICSSIENDYLKIKVEDDGIGINLSKGGSGLGLENLRRRAKLIGAYLEIGERLGGGTSIEISLKTLDL